MTDATQPAPEEKGKITGTVKRRLIWLGIFLALLMAYEIVDLIMHIVHPSM